MSRECLSWAVVFATILSVGCSAAELDASAIQCGSEPLSRAELTELQPGQRHPTVAALVAADESFVYTVVAASATGQPRSGEAIIRMTHRGDDLTTLARTEYSQQLVLGQGQLYSSGSDSVLKITLDGSMPPELLAPGIEPREIAADSTRLYVADGHYRRCCINEPRDSLISLDAAGGGPTVLARELCYPHDLVSDGRYLYFATAPACPEDAVSPANAVLGLVIQRVPVTGGTLQPLATVPRALGLTLSHGWLYTSIDLDGVQDLQDSFRLARLPTKGGTLELDEVSCVSDNPKLLRTAAGVLAWHKPNVCDQVNSDDGEHQLIDCSAIGDSANWAVAGRSLFAVDWYSRVTRLDFDEP